MIWLAVGILYLAVGVVFVRMLNDEPRESIDKSAAAALLWPAIFLYAVFCFIGWLAGGKS
jgi:hypothetical protein